MDVTFMNFLPSPLQRNNLFLPYTNLQLLWSLSCLYYHYYDHYYQQSSCTEQHSDQLHIASPSKTEMRV